MVMALVPAIVLAISHASLADDFIRVLMLESPSEPMPSEAAEKMYSLDGKIFVRGRFYEGSLDVIKDNLGLYVVNKIPFEQYVEGVVSSEIGDEKEMEALKAQAVVARTYAMYYRQQNHARNFDISSSILHQAYRKTEASPFVSSAVNATRGEILTFEDQPINAVYHSTCEGYTELPEEIWQVSLPYLRSVSCNSEHSPYEHWQRRFTLRDIEKALGVAGIKDITIASQTATGRVKGIQILFDGGSDIPSNLEDGIKIAFTPGTVPDKTVEIKATEFRRLLGYERLPSTDFTVLQNGRDIVFAGKGSGHGVGLSQWGAIAMARQGKSYQEILAHFYPGAVLRDVPGQYQVQTSGNEKSSGSLPSFLKP